MPQKGGRPASSDQSDVASSVMCHGVERLPLSLMRILHPWAIAQKMRIIVTSDWCSEQNISDPAIPQAGSNELAVPACNASGGINLSIAQNNSGEVPPSGSIREVANGA